MFPLCAFANLAFKYAKYAILSSRFSYICGIMLNSNHFIMRTKSLLNLMLGLVVLVSTAAGCVSKPYVVWSEGETDPETRRACHVITVVNAPEGTDWAPWMTSNHIVPGEVEGTEGTIALHHGCLYKVTPLAHEGKNLVVKYTVLFSATAGLRRDLFWSMKERPLHLMWNMNSFHQRIFLIFLIIRFRQRSGI